MTTADRTTMLDLTETADGRTFDHPWQAHAFSLTVQLYKDGRFTWDEWVRIFSAEIEAAPALPGESVNDAYYRQWVKALEVLITQLGIAPQDQLAARAEEWRRAYLNTPHGQPILLANALCVPAGTHHHHHAPLRAPIAVSAGAR